jgi:hypothetical protein
MLSFLPSPAPLVGGSDLLKHLPSLVLIGVIAELGPYEAAIAC